MNTTKIVVKRLFLHSEALWQSFPSPSTNGFQRSAPRAGRSPARRKPLLSVKMASLAEDHVNAKRFGRRAADPLYRMRRSLERLRFSGRIATRSVKYVSEMPTLPG